MGDGGTGGTGIGVGGITNGASLVFYQNDTYSVLGDITGPGTLVQQGSTTLSLTGNNTYTGPTLVDGASGGSLQIGVGDGASLLGAFKIVPVHKMECSCSCRRPACGPRGRK